MHALEKIIVYYNQCKDNDTYKSVIEHILKNLDKVRNANIYELADLCYVSPTTISRLSRKMGYENFTDFKMSIVNCIRNYYSYNQFVPLSVGGDGEEKRRAYLNIMRRKIDEFEQNLDVEQIARINACIHAGRKVSFYTCGIDFAERHFQELLVVAGKESVVKTLPQFQLEDVKTLDENCVVVYVTPATSESGDIREVLEKIKGSGAKIILLTDTENYVYRKYSDELWWFHGAMSILDDQCFAMMLTMLAMDYRDTYVDTI